jgi:hypothetical protein
LDAVELDVTVILTTFTFPTSWSLTVKSFDFTVVLFVAVKKEAALPSGAALMEMVTPLAGMADVIVIFSGKVGPKAGACVLPFAGVVVTVNVGSALVLLLPPQLVKNEATVRIRRTNVPAAATRNFIKNDYWTIITTIP